MNIQRRQFLRAAGGSGAATALGLLPHASFGKNKSDARVIRKPIPNSGRTVPAIGMGTWISFNVGDNKAARKNCADILRTFFKAGGSVIDSSPMYGSAEEVLGYCLQSLEPKEIGTEIFPASKIWTRSAQDGIEQFGTSLRLWTLPRFSLFQVHNLLSWSAHLKTLNTLKKKKMIDYTGITTSHGRRHDDMLAVMKAEKPDFIQVTYNVLDREVEQEILPLAEKLGIAVLANRPFQGGALFKQVKNKALPSWAKVIACETWSQLLLKFIISHPSVTCAIPATSQVAHMKENMGALYGALPDQEMRREIIRLVEA